MSEKQYPSSQPFNIKNARRNLHKRNAWWQKTPPTNNTNTKRGDKNA